MRLFAIFFALVVGTTLSVHAQVPTPMSTSSSISGAHWTKTNDYDYVLKDKNGNARSNIMDLNYLKTDTLGVFDRDAKIVYLLADFKNAVAGSSGKAVVLLENATDSFYITNPYSFYTVIDGETVTGAITNVKGSYVYYVADNENSYYLEGIRNYSNWGARAVKDMAYSANNTYWYRDTEKKSYGVIKEGKAINYDEATTEADGNDLIVKINGVSTYILKGYYTMASFVFNPVTMYSGSSSTTTVTSSGGAGCVSGDCQDGWGKYEFENGHYDGFWKNGLKDGYGLYKWEGSGKYIGNWDDDKMSGYGVYIAENKDNIIGNYENGQLNGVGITVTGDVWEQGIFANGNLSTKHEFFSNDVETGCTAGDCQNKYGRMKWSNGDSYTGFFKNGNLYMGTYTFASGDKYSGMFNSESQFHGTGRFFFKSGEYYGGSWVNGKYEGRGYYHDKDLVQQIGVWSKGSLVTKMK